MFSTPSDRKNLFIGLYAGVVLLIAGVFGDLADLAKLGPHWRFALKYLGAFVIVFGIMAWSVKNDDKDTARTMKEMTVISYKALLLSTGVYVLVISVVHKYSPFLQVISTLLFAVALSWLILHNRSSK